MDKKAIEAIREALANAKSVLTDSYNQPIAYLINCDEKTIDLLQQLLDEIEDYEDLKRQFAGLKYANIDNLKVLEQLRDENERIYKTSMETVKKATEQIDQLQAENERMKQRLLMPVGVYEGYEKLHVEIKQLQSDKAIAVNALIKIRNMTPYGLYLEIIDAALEQIEEGEKDDRQNEDS